MTASEARTGLTGAQAIEEETELPESLQDHRRKRVLVKGTSEVPRKGPTVKPHGAPENLVSDGFPVPRTTLPVRGSPRSSPEDGMGRHTS